MHAEGAPQDDRDRIDEALATPTGIAGRACRFVATCEGEVVVNEALAGDPVFGERVWCGPVPDLVPLIKHRVADFSFVVAEIGRDGGEISIRSLAGLDDVDQHLQGDTENLTKVPGGGLAQHNYLHRTEEIWRRNASELATAVDHAVRQCDARALVVAGDVRAVELLVGDLSPRSTDVLSVLHAHTRTDGASPDALDQEIHARVDEVVARAQAEALDRLEAAAGQDGGSYEHGYGAVISALQQAQVDTLFMDDSALGEKRLLALSDSPWVATSEQDTLGTEVLGEVAAPVGILRAAALTDAAVHFVPAAALDGDNELAALLRWPTGPS